MAGPGAYLPDATEGITKPEDLPRPKVVRRSRNFKHQPCRRCQRRSGRNSVQTRILHDVGDLVAGRPRDLHLVYSQHRCTKCNRFFNADTSEYALPKSHYTHRVVSLAVLAKLRQRVRRFKQVGKILNKLYSPNLDKALTFLDDKLLPSTSNAVERGNRRHRKMQKTVYRVRTREHIHNRIALDMLRDSQKEDRSSTLTTLHRERAAG